MLWQAITGWQSYDRLSGRKTVGRNHGRGREGWRGRGGAMGCEGEEVEPEFDRMNSKCLPGDKLETCNFNRKVLKLSKHCDHMRLHQVFEMFWIWILDLKNSSHNEMADFGRPKSYLTRRDLTSCFLNRAMSGFDKLDWIQTLDSLIHSTFFQGKTPNMIWSQPLQCQEFATFSVSVHCGFGP